MLAELGGHAGLLLGYVDAWFTELGYKRGHTEQWSCDKLFAALRETLHEDELAQLLSEGASWSEGRAVEEALQV